MDEKKYKKKYRYRGKVSFYAIFVKDKKILFKRIHTYEQSTIYVLNYFGIRIVNTHVEQKRGKIKTP